MVEGGAELVKSVGPGSPVGIDPVNELRSSINSVTSDTSPISVGIVPDVYTRRCIVWSWRLEAYSGIAADDNGHSWIF